VSSKNALGLVSDERGLCLRALGLWLDPLRPAPAAFVSHAHALTGCGSGRVLASPETIALARGLGIAVPEAVTIEWNERIEWPIDPHFGGGTASLSIAPAGHLLGAAQLIVDHPRGRFVYAGDWSAQRDATHAQGEVVTCDELLVTSTFALPIFRFEPIGQTCDAVVEWCAARLLKGETPVVLAQTPGPAQSFAALLASKGLLFEVTDDVQRGCAAYDALGVPIGPVQPLLSAKGKEPCIVIAHAGSRADDLRSIARACVAYASPWALLDAAVEQKRAHAAFVVADHAGYDDLVAMVRGTGATAVHVSRGDAREFAHLLSAQGFDADAFELPAIDERGTS
jgi:putative mRNA 3-end processing factor